MKNSSSSVPQLYQDLKRETEPLRKVKNLLQKYYLHSDWSPLNSLWMGWGLSRQGRQSGGKMLMKGEQGQTGTCISLSAAWRRGWEHSLWATSAQAFHYRRKDRSAL